VSSYDIVDVFRWGMKRDIVPLIDPAPDGPILNLGAGRVKYDWPEQWAFRVTDLDMPDWDAEVDGLTGIFSDNSIGGIFAFHFLEHLEDPAGFLQEVQKVLKPGAPATFVVPFYNTQGAIQDLGHKHFFCEDTWRILMQNEYYDPSLRRAFQWHLKVGTNLLVGVAERNIALMTQFIKE
jgi:SAM-dependent methyltransferase